MIATVQVPGLYYNDNVTNHSRCGKKEKETENDPYGASRAKISADVFTVNYSVVLVVLTLFEFRIHTYRVAPAFFKPSWARSFVIGPMTTSRIVP